VCVCVLCLFVCGGEGGEGEGSLVGGWAGG
jgi:hypothetical protein